MSVSIGSLVAVNDPAIKVKASSEMETILDYNVTFAELKIFFCHPVKKSLFNQDGTHALH